MAQWSVTVYAQIIFHSVVDDLPGESEARNSCTAYHPRVRYSCTQALRASEEMTAATGVVADLDLRMMS